MVLIIYGTRPEVIKLSPVIKALRTKSIPHKTIFTGQHKELFNDVKSLVPSPDYSLDVMKANQTSNHVISTILVKLQAIIFSEKPRLVIVQGDTSTVLAAALCSFNSGIAVGHVEAGLRTYNIDSPFPEEANRQLVARIATFNWAPTQIAADNLIKEGVKNVLVTGNTVIDTCLGFNFETKYSNKILITLHRRENHGERMISMFKQLNKLAVDNPSLEFIFPMHPNPNVQKHKNLLEHVKVIPPLNEQAKLNLTGNARDLWVAGIRDIKSQSANLKSIMDRPGLREDADISAAIEAAIASTDELASWL
ncbi:MAG: UDP-N-acetylglucosamine 2-epimerase (non-hydrolyzing), partial [Bacteroidota bacterium]